MSAFGDNLKRLRESRGMSITELARNLGLSRPTCSLYEKGVSEPSLLTIKRMADTLGVPVDALFDGLDEQTRQEKRRAEYEYAKERWEAFDCRITEVENDYVVVTPPFDDHYPLELKKTDFVQLTKEMENDSRGYMSADERLVDGQFKVLIWMVTSRRAAQRRENPHNLIGRLVPVEYLPQ